MTNITITKKTANRTTASNGAYAVRAKDGTWTVRMHGLVQSGLATVDAAEEVILGKVVFEPDHDPAGPRVALVKDPAFPGKVVLEGRGHYRVCDSYAQARWIVDSRICDASGIVHDDFVTEPAALTHFDQWEKVSATAKRRYSVRRAA